MDYGDKPAAAKRSLVTPPRWSLFAPPLTDQLKVPKNLTIILLPSRSPELNPVENIWQYLRQNWLSNRIFEDYDAIIEAGCQACNKLIDQPETIMSIGMRDWAISGQ